MTSSSPFDSLSADDASAGAAPLTQIRDVFLRDWQALVRSARQAELNAPAERRYSDPSWQSGDAALMAQAHQLTAHTLRQMAAAAPLEAATRARLDFLIDQWAAVSAPSNFLATNPQAQAQAKATGTVSLDMGLRNLLADARRGRISQVDTTRFELGRDLASTPGSVVFETPYCQLIQYAAQTPSVHVRPVFIVPPNINKYYILDLRPENSLVRHLVQAGYTVFMLSWRNPLPDETPGIDQGRWDDYVDQAILPAMAAARDITGAEMLNAVGFCIGGTMLSTALATARSRGADDIASLTLLTAPLDFSDPGVLGVFVDEAHVRWREQQLGAGGLMRGAELAATFNQLRPSELVWNYTVDNYLMGRTPPAWDLLYWNDDAVNLPGPFFTWYFRHAYLQNDLIRPGAVQVGGQPLDLSKLAMPVYIFASHDDHIVPWRTAYASRHWLSGPSRFVLGASGHVAGVVNPPGAGRRHHWVAPSADASTIQADPDAWLAWAERRAGSWWTDWFAWLAAYGGGERPAPADCGNSRHRVIEAAPGRYVRERAAAL